MGLIVLLGWVIYGMLVGVVAKAIYKGAIPSGFIPTMLVGVCGSFVGGFLKYLLLNSSDPFQPSGLIFGVIGGVITCFAYTKLKSQW